MFREIPLLLLIGGMIKGSRNISVSLGDLKQPEDCQDFLSRFEVNPFLNLFNGEGTFALADYITEVEVEISFGSREGDSLQLAACLHSASCQLVLCFIISLIFSGCNNFFYQMFQLFSR